VGRERKQRRQEQQEERGGQSAEASATTLTEAPSELRGRANPAYTPRWWGGCLYSPSCLEEVFSETRAELQRI
jgi:hypothetical protein